MSLPDPTFGIVAIGDLVAPAVVGETFVHVDASVLPFTNTFVTDVTDAVSRSGDVLASRVDVATAIVGETLVDVGATFLPDAFADKTVFALASS